MTTSTKKSKLLWSLAEAAAEIGCTRKALAHWLTTGVIGGEKIGGYMWVIDQPNLDKAREIYSRWKAHHELVRA